MKGKNHNNGKRKVLHQNISHKKYSFFWYVRWVDFSEEANVGVSCIPGDVLYIRCISSVYQVSGCEWWRKEVERLQNRTRFSNERLKGRKGSKRPVRAANKGWTKEERGLLLKIVTNEWNFRKVWNRFGKKRDYETKFNIYRRSCVNIFFSYWYSKTNFSSTSEKMQVCIGI